MSEPCTHPDHEKEWTACPACLARDTPKTKTIWECPFCRCELVTEESDAAYQRIVRIPNKYPCDTCRRRINHARDERRNLESVARRVVPVRPTVERRSMGHPVFGYSISVDVRPRRAGIVSALRRLIHMLRGTQRPGPSKGKCLESPSMNSLLR